jgi:hypothetical protein
MNRTDEPDRRPTTTRQTTASLVGRRNRDGTAPCQRFPTRFRPDDRNFRKAR